MLNVVMQNSRKIITILIVFFLFSSAYSLYKVSAEESEFIDLIITNIDCPSTMFEGEQVKIVVEVKNQGTINISADENNPIEVGLYIVNGLNLVATNNTIEGLDAGNTSYVNLSWIPTIGDRGQHFLRIIVNYDYIIDEDGNYNNNAPEDILVRFSEKKTDLEIINIELSETPQVNKTVNIVASVKNTGEDTNLPIFSILNTSREGEIDNATKVGGLLRDEIYDFSFNWTPVSLGSQTLIVRLYHDGVVISKEKTVFVNVSKLQWWDANWHYRYFLVFDGADVIYRTFDFTSLLNDLDIDSQVFENEKIVIVEYATNGDIVRVVDDFKFNESIDFDSLTNANGTLIWDASDSNAEKYFCVYFDVEANPGVRVSHVENEDILGNILVTYEGFVEGWWTDIVTPGQGSYCLINETKNISVMTSAIANEVTAEFFWNNSLVDTLELIDIDSSISWFGEYNFSEHEGNWTINVTSRDATGYPNLVSLDFYVGKPDLELVNITYSTDWPTSPVVYKNDTVNITACVISHYANIQDVNVSLFINEFFNVTIPLVLKDKNNYISFIWKPNETGKYFINLTVDPDNLVDENNESNNQILTKKTVYGWPDLEIDSIILPAKNATEFDNVTIEVIVSNFGEGDAINYKIFLYVKQYNGTNGHTFKFNETYNKDNVSFSVDKGSTQKVIMNWDSAESGEWMVGAKIFVSETKKDTNMWNNQNVSIQRLFVKAVESNIPVIHSVDIDPDPQEQGGTVKITAEITDDSGLESVIIIIYDPYDAQIGGGDMIKVSGNWYRFDFDDTLEDGIYTFRIEAVDFSLKNNKAIEEGSFEIIKDITNPIIHFYDVEPGVQLKNEYVKLICIVSDNVGIKRVTATINPPIGSSFDKEMLLTSEGKNVYEKIYNITGMYSYYLTVEDLAGNILNSDNSKIFWITTDLNDIDNDGMPNSWEEKYGLNPEDPNDANKDKDNDGISNLDEYKRNTNPSQDILMENIGYRVKENIWYLSGSVILFLIILLLSIFDLRRKKQ